MSGPGGTSGPGESDDTPVRGASEGESGYRDGDYWRKIDQGYDVDDGAAPTDTVDDTPAPGPALDADSPQDIPPER